MGSHTGDTIIIVWVPVLYVTAELGSHAVTVRVPGEDYHIGPPTKVHYLFPLHAKRARVKVRVVVQFGSVSPLQNNGQQVTPADTVGHYHL